MATNIKTVMTYPLDGSTTDFNIPFEYLARKFVRVALIGVDRKELILNQDYRFATKTTISTTRALGPADGYNLIEIRRYTSATERLVDFTDGSILRAYDLNISQIQTLHVAEEARDLTADTIGVNNDGDLDARGRRIVNVANAVDPQDAVTLGQIQAWNNSAYQSAQNARASEDRAWQHKEAARVSDEHATTQATSANNANTWAKKWATDVNVVEIGPGGESLRSSKTYSEWAKGDAAAAYTWKEQTLTYRNEAEGFKNQAATSEVNAKTSENNAKASESNAATSAATASTSEGNAKTSANAAAASQQAAAASQQAAAASQQAAKSSENNSKVSENNARGWAQKAEDSPVTGTEFSAYHYSRKASKSAAAASTSEGNAKTSENNAKTSEVNAKASEDRAILEASKLGNMNNLTASIESAPGTGDFHVKWKGIHVFKGGWQVASTSTTDLFRSGIWRWTDGSSYNDFVMERGGVARSYFTLAWFNSGKSAVLVDSSLQPRADIQSLWTGSAAYADQWTADASLWTQIPAGASNRYYPIIKQKSYQAGRDARAWHLGTLVRADGRADWNLINTSEGGVSTIWTFEFDGGFVTPGTITVGGGKNIVMGNATLFSNGDIYGQAWGGNNLGDYLRANYIADTYWGPARFVARNHSKYQEFRAGGGESCDGLVMGADNLVGGVRFRALWVSYHNGTKRIVASQ